jgi:two-component system sensor histidine kinase RpfC
LVIRKILERAGHTVTIVNNGQEALDELENNDYNLIILDMQMPIMGGIEAAKIYNFSTNVERRAPIIILTANATTEALRECEDANIDAYLTKPINIEKLLTTISRFSKKLIQDMPQLCETTDNQFKNIESSITEIPLIDEPTLNSIKELSTDDNFFHELIGNFLSDTKKLISEMEKAIAEEDFARFREIAHALKGSAGSIGANRLHDLCNEAKLQTNCDYTRLLTNIVSTFDKTSHALDFYVKNNNPRQKNAI